MEEQNYNELVTKGLLLAFGTKCKRMFKLNPVHAHNETVGRWIKISTSLDWSEDFDDLYINIYGITTGSGEFDNEKKTVNSNFYIKYIASANNEAPYFAQGVNLGTEIINVMVIAEEEEKTVIYLSAPDDRYPNDIIVDTVACKGNDLLFKVVEEDGISFLSSLDEPYVYEQIATDNNLLPFDKTPIGEIVVLLQQETQFTIIENEENNNITSYKSYPLDSVFDRIFKATLADKLSHGLTFQYDWENPIKSTDSAVAITNGTLTQGSVVKIPIPSFLNNVSTDTGIWATKVQVLNGLVTDVDTTSGIDLATSSTIGGIKLLTDSTSCVGDKVPVLLDSIGQAFIDKAKFNVDKHRDDLTKLEYHGDNINKFINNIWQHIGVTTDTFINGYFYKCTKTTFTILYDDVNSPYSIGSQIGTKLERFIYNNGLALDLNKPFRLYVETYPQQIQVESVEQDVKISDLEEFKLCNLNSQGEEIISSTYTITSKLELSDILDITIKTTDGWDTALTKDYPQSVMTLPFTLNSTSYAWKQWDVQPRTGIGSALEFITNDEIDYLFETHVNHLSLGEDTWLELSIGDNYTLEVEVLPEDADNKMVNWYSSDPSAVSVVKTSPTEAEVTVGSDAVVGKEYIITCTSVSDSTKSATCTITIVG